MPLLTVQQAAQRLHVSPSTVYELCGSRRIAHVRVGLARGTIRIDEAELEAFIRKATVQPAEPAAPQPRKAKKMGASGFKNLDADRLLEAWRQQGVLADQPGERSAPSSGSSCDPSVPPGS
jgi:excisionase family DNA binding protein